MVMLGILTGLVTLGNNIGNILQTWADMGIFAYALPFLLIFAVVFGILWQSKILGENRGVIVVIAVAVGLMSLQFDFVPSFFAVIFPYAGVGIAILLVALILMGLFTPDNDKSKYFLVFYIIGALIALIVILSALTSYEWWGGWWWFEYSEALIALLIIGGLIALVISAVKGKDDGGKRHRTVRVPVED